MPIGVPADVDWSVIKALWVAEVPNSDLAKEYGVTEEAIRQQAHRNEWHEVREVVKKRHEKEKSRAITSAVNIVQRWKDETIQNVAEAGLETSRNLRKIATGAGENFAAQAEAFQQFEPVARVLKPFLGLNEGPQMQVGVSVNILSDLPEDAVTDI